MILMVAGALNLERLAVEKEPLVASKRIVRTPKLTRSAIPRFAASLDGYDCRIKIGRIHRPQCRIGPASQLR